jgi:hypothetical protein
MKLDSPGHRSRVARLRKCCRVALLGIALAASGACTPASSPEQQVRAVVAAGEAAAERRDHRALMALVSTDFEDAYGGGDRELSRMLRAYLVAHPSVHLVTRVESVEFPYTDLAQLRLTVGTLGREAGVNAEQTFNLAADLHSIELELRLEDDDWKVTRAEWNSLVSS